MPKLHGITANSTCSDTQEVQNGLIWPLKIFMFFGPFAHSVTIEAKPLGQKSERILRDRKITVNRAHEQSSTLPPPDRPQYMPRPSHTRWSCPRRARGARARRKHRPPHEHAVHAPARSRPGDAFSRRTSRRITKQIVASQISGRTTQPGSLQTTPPTNCAQQLAMCRDRRSTPSRA